MLVTNGKLITWEKENRILEDYIHYIEVGEEHDIG